MVINYTIKTSFNTSLDDFFVIQVSPHLFVCFGCCSHLSLLMGSNSYALFFLSKLIYNQQDFLFPDAGIDYLSVAAWSDLIPSHLVFLEGRVWQFFVL